MSVPTVPLTVSKVPPSPLPITTVTLTCCIPHKSPFCWQPHPPSTLVLPHSDERHDASPNHQFTTHRPFNYTASARLQTRLGPCCKPGLVVITLLAPLCVRPQDGTVSCINIISPAYAGDIPCGLWGEWPITPKLRCSFEVESGAWSAVCKGPVRDQPVAYNQWAADPCHT